MAERLHTLSRPVLHIALPRPPVYFRHFRPGRGVEPRQVLRNDQHGSRGQRRNR